jgi:tRNA A37 threonylcarbamoyltransferase TsaD
MAKIMCKERDSECFVPENQFLVDNAAMIAYQGYLERRKATKSLDTIDIKPYWRTDEVKVDWR